LLTGSSVWTRARDDLQVKSRIQKGKVHAVKALKLSSPADKRKNGTWFGGGTKTNSLQGRHQGCNRSAHKIKEPMCRLGGADGWVTKIDSERRGLGREE